jgi:type I restriction enzyme S subunit
VTELPAGWVEEPLATLGVAAQSGFPSGQHNTEGRGFPHLRPMNVDRLGRIDLRDLKYVEEERDRWLVPGDVLFNNTNSPALIGKTAYFDRPGRYAFSNHMTRLRPPAGVDPKFLALQLHTMWMRGTFQRLCSHHVNQASVSSSRLVSEVALSLAPLKEQRRIVAAIEEHLSRLDAGDVSLAAARSRLSPLRGAALTDAFTGEWPLMPMADVVDPERPIRYGILMPKEHIDDGVLYVRVKDYPAG